MKIVKLLPFIVLLSNSLSAEVRFDVRFLGQYNEFNHKENAWMKEAVLEAANDLGKCIRQDAVVTIEVYSSLYPTHVYATSHPVTKEMESCGGKVIELAMDKIINKEFSGLSGAFNRLWAGFCDFCTVETFAGEMRVCSERVTEGMISFNTERFSDFKTLKKVASHELTHSLGFSSSAYDGNSISSGKKYSPFDQLVVDKNGEPLLTGGEVNRKSRELSEVFICGDNIKKRNDGKCIRLFNPPGSAKGSSFSHFDTETYPRNLMNHISSLDTYPTWNKHEIGVMEDLGYQIDWKNYCQIMERDVFKTHRLSVDMVDPDAKNSYFILRKPIANDFPQECFPEGSRDEVFHESFSVPFAEGYELEYFVDGQLVCTLTSIKAFENLDDIFGCPIRLESTP